jgi:NAD(P)H-hydrate repair Nnr-like enzyme with NAD(P)H-hydrate dehydratase domain
MDPFAAAAAAVLAVSDAGDLAATRVGAGHTVAGDVIQALPEALASPHD